MTDFDVVVRADGRALWRVGSLTLLERCVLLVEEALGIGPTVEAAEGEVQRAAAKQGLQCISHWSTEGSRLVFDPLVIPVIPAQVMQVVTLFVEARPSRLVTVAELPSHLHPKKLLVLGEGGRLRHVDPGGPAVFRRQQLAEEPIYCEDGAIVGYRPEDDAVAATLAVILSGERVRVTERQDVTLAEAWLGLSGGGGA